MVKIVFLSVLLFMATPASGEYYQYEDSQGNQRFTDDVANIPEDQRTDIKTFESVQSEPQQDMTGEDAVQEEDASDNQKAAEETDTAKAKPSVVGVDRKKIDELNATREELRKTFAALEAERNAIGPPPPKNAKSVVKKEYNNKISELNRKINAYQQRTKEFDEKVKAYNSQIGK
ncbi:MAG: DUF4124 domain-containing protein [Desulfosalsimonadaceae bacterium]